MNFFVLPKHLIRIGWDFAQALKLRGEKKIVINDLIVCVGGGGGGRDCELLMSFDSPTSQELLAQAWPPCQSMKVFG